MSIPQGKRMSKKMFVKRALHTEYTEQEKRIKQESRVSGQRKINGRQYEQKAVYKNRTAAENDARDREQFTSVQRTPDGWGVFVMIDTPNGIVGKIRSAIEKERS